LAGISTITTQILRLENPDIHSKSVRFAFSVFYHSPVLLTPEVAAAMAHMVAVFGLCATSPPGRINNFIYEIINGFVIRAPARPDASTNIDQLRTCAKSFAWTLAAADNTPTLSASEEACVGGAFIEAVLRAEERIQQTAHTFGLQEVVCADGLDRESPGQRIEHNARAHQYGSAGLKKKMMID
jgi:hypothetical protein